MSLERYSSAGRLREQKMRLISGIVGAKLMEESRFPEAEPYVEPLIAWVELPNEGGDFLTSGETDDDLRASIVSAVDVLKKAPNCTKEELSDVSEKLVRVLNELGSRNRP